MKLFSIKVSKKQKDTMVAICCMTLLPMIYVAGRFVIMVIDHVK